MTAIQQAGKISIVRDALITKRDDDVSEHTHNKCQIAITALNNLCDKEEWQPIESAPRDWDRVNRLYYGRYAYVSSYMTHSLDGNGKLISYQTTNGNEPTHWMPLPPAPTKSLRK